MEKRRAIGNVLSTLELETKMDNFEKSAVLVLIGAAISRDYLGYAFLGCAIMFAARIAEYIAFDMGKGEAKSEETSRVSPLVQNFELLPIVEDNGANDSAKSTFQARSPAEFQVKDEKEQLNVVVSNMSTEEYFKNVKPLFANLDEPASSLQQSASSLQRDTTHADTSSDATEMNDEEFIEMIVNLPETSSDQTLGSAEEKKPRTTKAKRGKKEPGYGSTRDVNTSGGAKDGEPLSQSIFRMAPHGECAMMEEREETSMIQHYSSKMCGETFEAACKAVAKDGMKVHIAQANHSSRIVQPTQYDLKTIVVKVEDKSFDFVNNAPSEYAIVTDVIGIARYDPALPINRIRK